MFAVSPNKSGNIRSPNVAELPPLNALTLLSIVFAIGVGVVAGVLVQLLLAEFTSGSLLLTILITLGVFVSLLVFAMYPALLVIACAGAIFSSASAVLHGEYGLPVITKYMPIFVVFAYLSYLMRSADIPLMPRLLRLPMNTHKRDLRIYILCLTLLALLYVFTLIPVFYAANPELAWLELNLQRRHMLISLTLAIAVGSCGRGSGLHFICWVALLATSLIILLAILGSLFPSLEYRLPGFTSVHVGLEPGDRTDRIAGAYGHPNTLGRYAVFMLPIAVGLYMVSRGVVRYLTIPAFMILMFGLVLSESRGALLVLLILLVPGGLLMLRYIRPVHFLVGLALAGLSIFIAWDHVDIDRVVMSVTDLHGMIAYGATPVDGALRGRLSEMEIAYEIWKQHPILGVGLANYEHFFQIYSFDNGTKLYNADRAAHSLYLELIAERGIIGLIGYLIAIGGLIVIVMLRSLAMIKAGASTSGYLTASLVFSAVAYYLSAMFLHDVHPEPLWGLVGLMIASTKIDYQQEVRH